MKKKEFKSLRLAKKSISNLTMYKGGFIAAERSKHRGATCLICPSFATVCPECPSGEVKCGNNQK